MVYMGKFGVCANTIGLKLDSIDARLHGDNPAAMGTHGHGAHHFWHLPMVQLIGRGLPTIDLASRNI